MNKLIFGLLGLLITHFLVGQNPIREFRGAWIATVENIDWPSKPGLTVDEQKQEFISMLDQLKAAGMNAAVVQVRPAADAFFPSPLEPWSPYLTGVMDQAPNPYYDPLKFMIEETHKRAMEFHAWLNPYRALNHEDLTKLSVNHPKSRYPHLFLKYGGKYYFNPGEPRAREHVVQVVEHILDHYDIDAIHFDDYFYPYKVAGEEFPDAISFKLYGAPFQYVEDWRRHNVNELIRQIYNLIKQKKPYVQFGISPFSVWRNLDKDPINGSPTRAGQTCYDDLYADIVLWLKNGWIDYVAPQLYFALGFELVDPEIMMKWWSERSHASDLYIGQGMYRVDSDRPGWKDPNQIPQQIKVSRQVPKVKGSIFFSAKSILKNPLNVVDRLQTGVYSSKALLPEHRIRNFDKPTSITDIAIRRGNDYANIIWKTAEDPEAYYFVIYRFEKGEIRNIENPNHIIGMTGFGSQTTHYLDRSVDKKTSYTYIVVPVNRDHVLGSPSEPITATFR